MKTKTFDKINSGIKLASTIADFVSTSIFFYTAILVWIFLPNHINDVAAPLMLMAIYNKLSLSKK